MLSPAFSEPVHVPLLLPAVLLTTVVPATVIVKYTLDVLVEDADVLQFRDTLDISFFAVHVDVAVLAEYVELL